LECVIATVMDVWNEGYLLYEVASVMVVAEYKVVLLIKVTWDVVFAEGGGMLENCAIIHVFAIYLTLHLTASSEYGPVAYSSMDGLLPGRAILAPPVFVRPFFTDGY